MLHILTHYRLNFQVKLDKRGLDTLLSSCKKQEIPTNRMALVSQSAHTVKKIWLQRRS